MDAKLAASLAAREARQNVRDRQQTARNHPMFAARLVAKGWGHGGYDWYAVTSDGALLCSQCVRDNWRQIVDATRNRLSNGWQVTGYTNSGELDQIEHCDNCNKELSREIHYRGAFGTGY